MLELKSATKTALGLNTSKRSSFSARQAKRGSVHWLHMIPGMTTVFRVIAHMIGETRKRQRITDDQDRSTPLQTHATISYL